MKRVLSVFKNHHNLKEMVVLGEKLNLRGGKIVAFHSYCNI